MKKEFARKKVEPENVGAVHTHTQVTLNKNKRAGENSALKVMEKKESQRLKI